MLAILAIVSSILFPVFSQVKAEAKRATCISNFRNVTQGATLYTTDYSDVWMPVNHQPAGTPNSRNDRTWVQLVLPYVRSFSVYQCPSDRSNRPKPEATFDQDLVTGDLYSRYYQASQRVNTGYNFQYFSPIVRQNRNWQARPRNATSLADPSRTVVFVDSVWDAEGDQPSGGGSWLVVPPCRFEQIGSVTVDTFAVAAGASGSVSGQASATEVFTPVEGWAGAKSDFGSQYGGVWPWHRDRATVAMADGSARSLTVSQLGEGCEIRPRWEGRIYDAARYRWFSR